MKKSENVSDLLYNRTIIEHYLIISIKEPFLYNNVAIMVGARPNILIETFWLFWI